jgi:hypothetical protein
MRTARIALEGHRDGDWELRTSDLAELVDVLGEKLLAAFCSCFVHADRTVSLVAFLYLSMPTFRKGSIGERRNFLTFASFLVGTLKELAENLGWLKKELYARQFLDVDTWKAGLGRWQKWGTSGRVATARKKLSFHVDPDLITQGLRSLAAGSGKRSLIHGSTGKLRDSACLLAQDASLRGLELTLGDLRILGDPAQYLNITDSLEREFLRVLGLAGLKPILIRTVGRRVASGA